MAQYAFTDIERRVNNTDDLIHGVCRQFADATGWTLRYAPSQTEDLCGAFGTGSRDELPCWHADVHDGHSLLGKLSLELPEAWSDDRSFLTVCALADIIAGLLNRVCSMQRSIELRTQDISTLVELGLSVPNEEDLHAVLQRLLRAAVQLTRFRTSGFFLFDPVTNKLNLRVFHPGEMHPIPQSQRMLNSSVPDLKAFLEGVAVLKRGEHEDSEWLPAGMSLGICLPIHSGNAPLGTLWVFDRRRREPQKRELHILRSLAAQIALMLERVILKREHKTQQRLQKELRSVSENQNNSFVEHAGSESEIGFEIALCAKSRFEIGGDLCEVIPVEDGKTLLAVGDASGDSLPAAIIMTAVRGALRALTSGIEDDILVPEVVIDRVNRALFSITPAHQFMSFLYGIVDVPKMTLTYSNAGHPAPLLIREDGVTSLQSHGMVLGVVEAATYSQSAVALRPNDILIFYSDGISEAMDAHRNMFRPEGIIEAASRRITGSARDILHQIWNAYEAHVAENSDPDDRTLLVIKMK